MMGIDKRSVMNTSRDLKHLFWYQFSRRAFKAIEEGNKTAAYRLWTELREVVSTPYPPASQYGEPPHLRTGEGRDAIQVARIREGVGLPDSYEVYVEESGSHMLDLEFGTPNSGWDGRTPVYRPWFWPTVERLEPELDNIRLAASQFNYY